MSDLHHKATDREPIIVIGGPTASGKSPLALALADELRGAVVNADSMQVYAELQVLTARPGADDMARAPHHLYGFMPAARRCSVGLWLTEAKRVAAQCQAAGRLPLVVGGTGFYLDALVRGLSPIPDIPDEVRAELAERTAGLEPGELHAMAMAADPALAQRLHAGDNQRLVRLIEVYEATGEPLSAWQGLPRQDGWTGPVLTLVVEPERQALYAACDARFDAMMAMGALDEVRALADQQLPADLPAMRALGVPHLLAHLRGEKTLEEAISASKTATRRYAKRQLTWFRHQAPPETARLATREPAVRLDLARALAGQFLLTGQGRKA